MIDDDERATFRRWCIAVVDGQLIGIGGVVGVGGWLVYRGLGGLDEPLQLWTFYLVVVVLGGLAGVVLGTLQWVALREIVPGVSRSNWARQTGAASALVWAAAMLMPVLYEADLDLGWLDLVGATPYVEIAIWIVAALAIALAVAQTQARLLRHHVKHPQRWVTAHVFGQLAAIPIGAVIAVRAPFENDTLAFWFGFVVVSLAVAPVLAAVTGMFLVRMEPAPRYSCPPGQRR